MAIPLHNEVEITLNGNKRTLRADFTAIIAIEAALNASILSLTAKASQRDLSFTETATIIHHGIRGFGDTRMTFEEVGNACMADGFATASHSAVKFLSIALKGVDAGKPKPEKAETK